MILDRNDDYNQNKRATIMAIEPIAKVKRLPERQPL